MNKEIKQGYKQTKVGIIPEDWEVVKLGNICKFYKGKGISKENLSEEGIPCIRYGELYTTYNEKIDNVFSKTNVDIKELFLSKSNDIIIPASGETAIDIATASCVLHDNIALSGDLNVIRTKENGIFLSYYLNVVAKHRIASIAQGVSVVHLYSSQLENLFLSLPPIKEQEKIAEILTIWDEAITKQEELIKAKELQKKGLMQKLLSGEVRFSEFTDEWKEVTIDELFYLKKGQGLSKEKININGNLECILYGELYTTYSEIINEVKSKTFIEEGIKSQKDDILIPASTTTSAIDLAIASSLKKENVLLGGDINILRKKKNNINSEFIAKYLTHIKKYEIAKYAQGITIIHLYSKDFKHLKIKLPSLSEQDKIAKVLSLVDNELDLFKQEIEELKLQKKALMQKLLTGQVRVKV